ncbi:MAG: S8 family serine peptidase [Muribaculaceae bacterium]|nr:S8 family serine peptidase [Muribaculaceae bacterium]
MLNGKMWRRVLSVALAVTMLLSLTIPALASEEEGSGVHVYSVDNSVIKADLELTRPETGLTKEEIHLPGEMVRVAIVLEDKSTMEAGYSLEHVTANASAMAYRAGLQQKQAQMEDIISVQALGGKKLDVVWNLTLAANVISANVPYGKLDAIRAVPGVKSVSLETRYEPMVAEVGGDEPMMATSAEMIGSTPAYDLGYTGAGTRIAVIDTGTDTDHRSFDADAFKEAIRQDAKDPTDPEAEAPSYEEAAEQFGLMTAADIKAKIKNLNAYKNHKTTLTENDFYLNEKLPYIYNYVDKDLDVTHDNDGEGEHGSHVAGIATANRLVENDEGAFVSALAEVKTQGVAPDAQLITMKVFGKNGGAYDSDYMVAIEDAIVLECDSINLSLGSGNPGATISDAYQSVMEKLVKEQAVVAIAAGNAGGWADNTAPAQVLGLSYLYNDDVSLDMVGSPASFTNSLAVASVDNIGSTGNVLRFGENGDLAVGYNESTSGSDGTPYTNKPILTLDISEDGSGTEYEYVMTDGKGDATEIAALTAAGVDLTGKIYICQRGNISFYVKAQNGANAGAAASIIWNNQSGTINMDLSDYEAEAPSVSITQADGLAIIAASTKGNEAKLSASYENDNGAQVPYQFDYYTGKVRIQGGTAVIANDVEFYTMSSFSSWGVPGTLELKPEITAPGGGIYSVNGAVEGGQAYEVMQGTSMACPQVAGMAALVAQYIKDKDLAPKGGEVTQRQLAQSLLMSTAVPVIEEDTEYYYSILKQGAGLANVGAAINAKSYVTVDGQPDGKVKVELGEDAKREGVYTFKFTLHNLTDEEADYALNADVFTQDVFPQQVAKDVYWNFMDTWTMPLNAETTFTVDGEAAEVVTLAAGDAVEVTATIALAEEDLTVEQGDKVYTLAYGTDTLDDGVSYPSGAYIEAFVYAEELTEEVTEDGDRIVGTSHTIPVLGFYGNWSDASMFDKGSYLDYYVTGEESRYPYLIVDGDFNRQSNYFALSTPTSGGAFVIEGNPYWSIFRALKVQDDAAFDPARVAMNSTDGSTLDHIAFSPIRNAGGSLFRVVDAEDGTVYVQHEPGSVDAAFYYESAAAWQGTSLSYNAGWAGTKEDAKGNETALKNNTKVNVELILAPEYYATVSTEKTSSGESSEYVYDWEALLDGDLDNGELGRGAKLSTSITIDNEAPVINGGTALLNPETGSLMLSVKDNQYVAAVVVYNADGTRAVSAVAPDQAKPNTSYIAQLDLSGVYGTKFLVAAYDYAMNQSTVLVTVDEPLNGVSTGDVMFVDAAGTWNVYDGEETVSAVVSPAITPVAATYVDGYIYSVDRAGNLYVATEADMDVVTQIGVIGVPLDDMTYNPQDGKLYGVWNDYLVAIDKLSGDADVVAIVGVPSYPEYGLTGTTTLACDDEGNFYCVGDLMGGLYTFTLETADEPVAIAELPDFDEGQSLEYNANDGCLYWLQAKAPTQGGGNGGGEGGNEGGEGTNSLVSAEKLALIKDTVKLQKVELLTDDETEPGTPGEGDGNEPTNPGEGGGNEGPGTGTEEPTTPTTPEGPTTPEEPTQPEIGPYNLMRIGADEDGELVCEVAAELEGTGSAMIVLVPQKGTPEWAEPTAEVTGLLLDRETLDTLAGESTQLTAFVAPWTTTSKDVKWTSSNSRIAKVDANGVVTGVAKGEAVITATSVKNPKVKAECAVTVDVIEYTIQGALQDENGTARMYSMNLAAGKVENGKALESPKSITASTSAGDGNVYVAADSNSRSYSLYKVDPKTGESVGDASTAISVPLNDVARSEMYQDENGEDLVNIVWGGYLFPMQPAAEISVYGYNLSGALAQIGSSEFVAIANGGEEVVPVENEETGEVSEVVAETYWVLDDQGILWVFWLDGNGDIVDFNLFPVDFVTGNPTLMGYQATSGAYCSLMLSDDGEHLFLATYNETVGFNGTSEIYMIDYSEELEYFEAKRVGSVGDGVWPATIHAVTKNTEATKPSTSSGSTATAPTTPQPEPTTETVENEDGSVTTTVTETDGTVTATTTTPEGTVTEVVTEPDGTVTETTTTPEGTVTEKVTETDGTVTETATQPDGAKVEKVSSPEEGVSITVTDAEGETVAEVVIPAVIPEAEERFEDVPEGHWADEAIHSIAALGVVEGVGDNKYDMTSAMTRGQLATVLHRMSSEPAGTDVTFEDVLDGKYYTEGVAWAAKVGVVEGYSDEEFKPDLTITREQLALMLMRYAKLLGVDTEAEVEGLDIFTDGDTTHEWAIGGVAWCVKTGILQGKDEGLLDPTAEVTRAEVAVMIERFIELF